MTIITELLFQAYIYVSYIVVFDVVCSRVILRYHGPFYLDMIHNRICFVIFPDICSKRQTQLFAELLADTFKANIHQKLKLQSPFTAVSRHIQQTDTINLANSNSIRIFECYFHLFCFSFSNSMRRFASPLSQDDCFTFPSVFDISRVGVLNSALRRIISRIYKIIYITLTSVSIRQWRL